MKRQIISQLPPMGDPMAGGMPPMGADPMGGAPPGAAPRPSIGGPLKSIGEILYDFKIEEYIALHPGKEEEELAQDVWAAYGGSPNGLGDPEKEGSRIEKEVPPTPEETEELQKATENAKWQRLPAGKMISDITSLDELIGLMKSLMFGAIKKYSAPPAPAGGGMPPMASSNNSMKRMAIVDSFKKDLSRLKQYMG